jgi:hypothetical protein
MIYGYNYYGLLEDDEPQTPVCYGYTYFGF